MKEVLKELIDAKQNLKDVQIRFWAFLEKTYPNLINEDTDDFKNVIDEELEFLFSSCLKFKSGRITIKTSEESQYRENKRVLTRNPGLKKPHQSYSAFNFSNVTHIDSNGDLKSGEHGHSEAYMLFLSGIRGSQDIDHDKLKTLYKFLKEFVGWNKAVENFISRRYPKEVEREIKVNSCALEIMSGSFEIKFKIKKYPENLDISHITDYGSDEHSKDSEIENQKGVLKIWQNSKSIHRVLLQQEKRKRLIIKKAKNLLKQLKAYNKPFRVFLKLTDV